MDCRAERRVPARCRMVGGTTERAQPRLVRRSAWARLGFRFGVRGCQGAVDASRSKTQIRSRLPSWLEQLHRSSYPTRCPRHKDRGGSGYANCNKSTTGFR
jgi:hypothetical protein